MGDGGADIAVAHWPVGIPTMLRASVRALRHPAALAFCGVYLAATVALAVTGHADLLAFQVGIDALLAVLCLSTIAMTAGAPKEEGATAVYPRWRPALQLALVALYATYLTVFINGHAPAPAPALLAAVNRSADSLPMALRDPLLYFALPALALLATGVRPRGLGLGRGWRSWRVTAAWSVVPLYVVALALATGAAIPSHVFDSLAGNALRNGFFEEFLWRGAILGRLRPLVGMPWAVTLSSLGFGLWHLGPDASRLGGNLATGLAYCVICQATVGVGFAVAYVRTRNLLAPSVAHMLFNVA